MEHFHILLLLNRSLLLNHSWNSRLLDYLFLFQLGLSLLFHFLIILLLFLSGLLLLLLLLNSLFIFPSLLIQLFNLSHNFLLAQLHVSLNAAFRIHVLYLPLALEVHLSLLMTVIFVVFWSTKKGVLTQRRSWYRFTILV